MRAILLGTAVLMGLSGCARVAESRFNPINWFGSSEETPATTASGEIRPLIPEGRRTVVIDNRVLVQSVNAMSVDRTPSGAIVRASGTVPTQGYFNAELVSTGVSGGVLMLEFRAQPPAGFEAEGPARARQITAAYVIDAASLAAMTSVRVQGATNARSARR